MSAHFFKITLCYDKKWEIKLRISVNIYCRLPKLGMSTRVFKISLCYDKQENHRAYGTADEALSTTLVMFKKMFLF